MTDQEEARKTFYAKAEQALHLIQAAGNQDTPLDISRAIMADMSPDELLEFITLLIVGQIGAEEIGGTVSPLEKLRDQSALMLTSAALVYPGSMSRQEGAQPV